MCIRDRTYPFILNEIIEASNSIRPATYTSDNCIGQPAFFLLNLLLDLFGNNRLKITNNGWKRVRAHN